MAQESHPHWPNVFLVVIPREKVMGALASFRITRVVFGPDEARSNGPAQLVELAVVGDAMFARVGCTGSVGSGMGVGLGSGVGGIGVLVGMAALVMAIMVLAAATADAWICAGSILGAAGAQAPRPMAVSTRTYKTRFIGTFSILNRSPDATARNKKPA